MMGSEDFAGSGGFFLNSIVEDLVQPEGLMDSYCCNKAIDVVFLIRLF